MSENPDYPSFEAAERQFQTFLGSLGHRGRIRWVFPRDAVLLNHVLYLHLREAAATHEEAARAYERARSEGRPVELSTLGYGDEEIFAFVFSPTDTKEAGKNLMPQGLKLSAASTGAPCRAVRNSRFWPLLWWLGRRRRSYIGFLFHQEVGLVAREMKQLRRLG